MAGQPPDPRTLNSWEDAFQHPLPVVRKLEQQLRKNIDDNRQKLRSLVGASYRDLLGTAERIIEMDEQVQAVETYLGDIGKKCNARTIEKIAQNHVRMQRTKDERDGEHLRCMAQTKVLQNSLTAASRIVKARGDSLQASKLFVLSRLLHKSLTDTVEPPDIMDDLRRRLNKLRSRLLLYIEYNLAKMNADKMHLTNVLCAYALITSSSPKEVLRHFLQIRYDQLDNKIDAPSESDMLRMLDLYSQTLFDTRELFPRRFADALSQLSKVPLLQDGQIQSMPELNIDTHKSWIDEDVRTFTPWIRHDQLASSDATDALVAWAKQAQSSLLESLQTHLQHENDAREILASRHKFISKFIGLSSKIRIATPANAIQDLRVAFLTRLEELAIRSASLETLALDDVEVSRLATLDSINSSIWDLASADFDLSHGAFSLRQSMLDKQHGRDDNFEPQTETLNAWMGQVLKFVEIANDMGSVKWDDDLDFDLDDLDDGDSLQKALGIQDPEKLLKKLQGACQEVLSDVVQKITLAAESTDHSAFYLRTWREIDTRRRTLGARLSLPPQSISLAQLYQNVGRAASLDVVDNYVQSSKSRKHVAVTLWDGTPPLPVQPSPHAFKFLMDLHRQMSGTGADIWSSPCVFELKQIILDRLGAELDLEALSNSESHSELTNGHLEPEDGTENNEENAAVPEIAVNRSENHQLIQNIFDLYYLQRVFDGSRNVDEDESAFGRLIQALEDNSAMDDTSNSRLKKSAGDYWKRTYLMFGLLAPDHQPTKE